MKRRRTLPWFVPQPTAFWSWTKHPIRFALKCTLESLWFRISLWRDLRRWSAFNRKSSSISDYKMTSGTASTPRPGHGAADSELNINLMIHAVGEMFPVFVRKPWARN